MAMPAASRMSSTRPPCEPEKPEVCATLAAAALHDPNACTTRMHARPECMHDPNVCTTRMPALPSAVLGCPGHSRAGWLAAGRPGAVEDDSIPKIVIGR